MLRASLQEIATAVDGRLADVSDPHVAVTAPLSNDTRTIQAGGLFACLPGARADGHTFAPAAIAAGAAAVLAARPTGTPAIVVPDVVTAMGALAHWIAGRLAGNTTLAVTGSVGKTTTKDLLSQVLQVDGPTVATERSFNNEIGLPITVTRADADTRYLLLEMGARGIGHIRHLTTIVRPDIAGVLGIGTAHLGEFGSREATATAKGEILECLPGAHDGGVAVLNADDPLVAAMASRTGARVMTFGRSPGAEIRATHVRLDDEGRPSFRLTTPDGGADVGLRIHGEHQVTNALAAATFALAAGIDLDTVATVLNEATIASSGRMQILRRQDGITIINDAYNANPDSMAASFRAFAAMSSDRRRLAVLGEMYELGDSAAADHADIGRQAADAGITHVVAVGTTHAADIAESAAAHGLFAHHVEAKGDAIGWLEQHLRADDMVLVKGGNALGLETIANELLERGQKRV